MTASYDYIIVGAGSAGCVLAARLTEDPATNVLLLEFGGSDRSIHPDALGAVNPDERQQVQLALPHRAGAGSRRPAPACPRGRVLGGSSSINGLVYMRGHAHDFDQLGGVGLPRLGLRICPPYLRKSETFAAGGDEYRGGDGPLHVTAGNNMENPLYRAFVEAGD